MYNRYATGLEQMATYPSKKDAEWVLDVDEQKFFIERQFHLVPNLHPSIRAWVESYEWSEVRQLPPEVKEKGLSFYAKAKRTFFLCSTNNERFQVSDRWIRKILPKDRYSIVRMPARASTVGNVLFVDFLPEPYRTETIQNFSMIQETTWNLDPEGFNAMINQYSHTKVPFEWVTNLEIFADNWDSFCNLEPEMLPNLKKIEIFMSRSLPMTILPNLLRFTNHEFHVDVRDPVMPMFPMNRLMGSITSGMSMVTGEMSTDVQVKSRDVFDLQDKLIEAGLDHLAVF